jgi:DinB superfamily
MKKFLVPAALMVAAGLQAQTPDAMVQDLQRSWQGIKANIQAAAEQMPEDGYALKPTPEVRTFGAWVGHVADAQMGTCSVIAGNRQNLGAEQGAMTKAALLEALKKSMDACDAVYMGTTAANHDEGVQGFGGTTPRASNLYGNIAHSQECYGAMTVYLRLKTIVPPSTARRGQGKKKG